MKFPIAKAHMQTCRDVGENTSVQMSVIKYPHSTTGDAMMWLWVAALHDQAKPKWVVRVEITLKQYFRQKIQIDITVISATDPKYLSSGSLSDDWDAQECDVNLSFNSIQLNITLAYDVQF